MRKNAKSALAGNGKTKKKIICGILAFLAVACLALIIYGIYLYNNGVRFWGDARPSQTEVKKWTLENFRADGYKIWNSNPECFEEPDFDTGLITDTSLLILRKDKNHSWYLRKLANGEKAVMIAPKEGGWGILAYGWEINGAHEFALDAARVQGKNGVYKIYTKMTKDGLYGNGTAIQGWSWDKPENTPWGSPQPLLTKNKKIVLSFTAKIDKAKTGGGKLDYDWQMLSVPTFLTSPKLSKPLVIDLAFYVNRGTMWSRESNEDYHYQRLIVTTHQKKDAFRRWTIYTVDYSWFVADALKRFSIEYAADTLQLESLEFLSETMYGECEFEVDRLALYYRDEKATK